jgi:NAD(P)-dependent dehydrogenase (short-subunit alcohol dehydrogenase family)
MTITLITGASKGLGYETARRLIDLGHTVLVGARDPQRGTQSARDEYGHLDVAALTMLTVQYARALHGILVNAADPGFTSTDLTTTAARRPSPKAQAEERH